MKIEMLRAILGRLETGKDDLSDALQMAHTTEGEAAAAKAIRQSLDGIAPIVKDYQERFSSYERRCADMDL